MSMRVLAMLALIHLLTSCQSGVETGGDTHSESEGKIFYPQLISTQEFSENSVSFTQDENTLFISRTNDWEHQSGHLYLRKGDTYFPTPPITALDSIYNGAISPSGNNLIYCVRQSDQEEIFLIQRQGGKWSEPINLSEGSGIYGGYFYWVNEEELYFYVPINQGDLMAASLKGNQLVLTDSLKKLNTAKGTEFSPFVDTNQRFIIFTRYLEGDLNQQGMFVSFNQSSAETSLWSEPQRLTFLPYAWGPYVLQKQQLFLYTDGEDVMAMPLARFMAEINRMRSHLAD